MASGLLQPLKFSGEKSRCLAYACWTRLKTLGIFRRSSAKRFGNIHSTCMYVTKPFWHDARPGMQSPMHSVRNLNRSTHTGMNPGARSGVLPLCKTAFVMSLPSRLFEHELLDCYSFSITRRGTSTSKMCLIFSLVVHMSHSFAFLL